MFQPRYKKSNSQDNTVGVLDIGASKVSCFVAEMVPDAVDGQDAEIIGVGHQAGIGAGSLADLTLDQAVRNAVDKAEAMAERKLTQWHVAVSGRHIACRRLAVDLVLDGHAVLEDDLTDCYRKGASVAAADNMKPLHIWPATYVIDGHHDVPEPLGVVGDHLSVCLVSLSASRTALTNLTNCLERCRISPASFIAAPYASSLAVLQDEEKELGVLCLEIGAALTSFTLYRNGTLVFAGAVPLGSDHITRDIAEVFDLKSENAERVKTIFGTGFCAPGDELRYIDLMQDAAGNQLSVAAVAEVIGPRIEETLDLVMQALSEAGFDPDTVRRLVLTGGGSQLQGICALVETLRGVKVRIGRPLNIFGAPEAVSGSAFAVCAGMIRHLVLQVEGETYDIPHFMTGKQPSLPHPASHAASPIARATNWLRDRF